MIRWTALQDAIAFFGTATFYEPVAMMTRFSSTGHG
jgi:hypothetical protein